MATLVWLLALSPTADASELRDYASRTWASFVAMTDVGDDVLRKAFAGPGLERTLRPVIGAKRFTTGP
jgi:hypothetical protein